MGTQIGEPQVNGTSPQAQIRLTTRGRRLIAASVTAGVLLAGGVTAGVTAAMATATFKPVEVITVQGGDTLWALAEVAYPDRDPREGVSLLREMNPALSASDLAIGQRLFIRP